MFPGVAVILGASGSNIKVMGLEVVERGLRFVYACAPLFHVFVLCLNLLLVNCYPFCHFLVLSPAVVYFRFQQFPIAYK